MTKFKEQVKINGKPAIYAILFDKFKQVALDLGYMLTVHGSMANDMDMIAVAWVEEAESHEKLVAAIQECVGDTIWENSNVSNFEIKPHSRISYSLTWYGNMRIDLSIIPPQQYLP